MLIVLPELEVLRDLAELGVDLGDHCLGWALPIASDLDPHHDLEIVSNRGVTDVSDSIGEFLNLVVPEVCRCN